MLAWQLPQLRAAPPQVTVLGRLAEYQTVTGFRVTPVVGWVEPPLALKPDPVEVADIFEVRGYPRPARGTIRPEAVRADGFFAVRLRRGDGRNLEVTLWEGGIEV